MFEMNTRLSACSSLHGGIYNLFRRNCQSGANRRRRPALGPKPEGHDLGRRCARTSFTWNLFSGEVLSQNGLGLR
jgi:hypothetical protein